SLCRARGGRTAATWRHQSRPPNVLTMPGFDTSARIQHHVRAHPGLLAGLSVLSTRASAQRSRRTSGRPGLRCDGTDRRRGDRPPSAPEFPLMLEEVAPTETRNPGIRWLTRMSRVSVSACDHGAVFIVSKTIRSPEDKILPSAPELCTSQDRVAETIRESSSCVAWTLPGCAV